MKMLRESLMGNFLFLLGAVAISFCAWLTLKFMGDYFFMVANVILLAVLLKRAGPPKFRGKANRTE